MRLSRRSKPVRRVSLKTARRNHEYAKVRAAFIAVAGNCPVMLGVYGKLKLATEVHHKRGRSGALLLYTPHWLAVSADGHRWIHRNPEAAREAGWLAAVGEWGRQP
jgi:hypothetical protein